MLILFSGNIKMYVEDIKIEKIDKNNKSWLQNNTNITINVSNDDIHTVRPVCIVGDNSWGIVQQISRHINTKILFDGEESHQLCIMDMRGSSTTDIVDYYNREDNFSDNRIIMCCPDVDQTISMNEQIKLISEFELKQNIVPLFNVNTPFLIGDSFRQDVYLIDDDYNLTHPDGETFGSSFDYILQTIFGMKNLISKRAMDFMKEAIDSNDVEQIKRCLRKTGESFEKRVLYQKLEELKGIPAN